MPRRTIVDPAFPSRLRELRKSRRMSQSVLEQSAHVSRSHISELESGQKTPSLGTARALDEALKANGDLMAMVADPATEPPPPGHSPDRWWAEETATLVVHVSHEEFMLTRRRAMQVVVGSALLEPLDRWLTLDGAPGAMVRASSRGRLSDEELTALEQSAQVFRTWDDRYGGGLRRKAVIGQLNGVAELAQESHGRSLDRRLYLVMAELAKTAATMSWDTGRGVAAQRYYVVALRAAREAGDRAFAASTLGAMARQLLYLGRINDAVELVRMAQSLAAGRGTPRLNALLHTREAWAYVRLGRPTAFRRATEKAYAAVADTDTDDPQWMSTFDAAELAGVTGGRLLEMAHHDRSHAGEAAETISRAIQLRDPRRLRSLSLDKIGLAEARLLEGDVEEAARLGQEAVDVVEQTTSDRVRLKLAEFARLGRPYRDVPAMTALRDRVRPMVWTVQQ